MDRKSALSIRALALLALAGLVVALLAGCGGTTAPATTAPSEPGTTDGAALLEARCSSCHSVAKATGDPHTQAEWDQLVSQMMQKGAQLTDAEKSTLVEYLTATYGK